MDNNQLSFEAAKTIYNSSNNKEVLEALETVFPQLRKSEDERIKNLIYCLIRDKSDNVKLLENNGVTVEEALAWLEKQGENLPVGFYYVNNEGKKFYSDTFKYGNVILHVEKQDEQKPTDKIEPKFKVGDTMRTLQEAADGYTDGMPVVVSIDNEYYHCTNELIAIKDQDEYEFPPINMKHKPNDKVEPKFKVDDWVVNPFGDIWHIDSLDKKNYQVSNKGKYNYFPIDKQDEMHLWTIEDAKPGDLLFISTKLRNYWAMFKEYDNNLIFFYCYTCGKFNIGGYVPIDRINKINPLPFSPHSGRFYNKIKEAGYEWNDLNKKLVDINNNHQKFYAGDWVICTDQGGYEHIRQITNVEIFTPSYDSKEYYRYWTSDITWFGDAYDARLWTLDDAKDGDVLATSAGAFIYNGKLGGKCPGCYCGINTLGKFQIGAETHWTGKPVFPATKEERNLLFSKMKEAGYEWDDEKKELKKIEADKLTDFEGALFTAFSDGWQQYLNGETVNVAQWAKEHSAELLEVAKQNITTWSEDDNNKVKKIIAYLNELFDNYRIDLQEFNDYETWFKSLKQRLVSDK